MATLKLSGFKQLSEKLGNLGQATSKRTRAVLRSGAERIQQTAIDNAPIDKGNLESAIKIKEDRTGMNRRMQTQVYVDVDQDVDGRTKVGDYAFYLHHFGDWNLGPKSQQKAASGKAVGSRYLERAFEEHEPKLMKELNDAVERSLQ